MTRTDACNVCDWQNIRGFIFSWRALESVKLFRLCTVPAFLPILTLF